MPVLAEPGRWSRWLGAAAARAIVRTALRAAFISLLACAAVLLAVPRAQALDVPPLEGRVSDRAGVLSPDVRGELEARLAAYEQNTGHQLAVLLVDSLEGDPVEDFTMRVVEAWKLGRKDRDDGALLLVAVKDRRVRIEVGYGLEGDLPDALAGRIIREVMTPAFRQDDYARGVTGAVEAIMAATGGEGKPLPPPRAERRRERGGLSPYLLLLLVLLLFLGGGRGLGSAFLAGSAMGFGGRGFRGGGGGGGGFRGGGRGGFGGGGGGFGGGGASGSW